MLINMNEIRELIHLLDETSLTEIRIEYEELKLHLKKNASDEAVGVTANAANHGVVHSPVTGTMSSQSQPAIHVAADDNQNIQPSVESDEGLFTVPSPMVGTFYRSPSPDLPVFVDIGSKVTEKSILCIVEAMKLMNEIEAEVTGEVVEILVKNGELVEYGQPLFKIRLS